MKKLFLLLCLVGTASLFFIGKTSYPKKKTRKEKVPSVTLVEKDTAGPEARLRPFLTASGYEFFPDKIAFVVLKEEQIFELWGKQRDNWKLIKKYPFTAYSGQLGPKLMQGDKQIPEGVYKISFLNPNSSYHLSLKINYPNDFDKTKAALEQRSNLGGDIFIHGKAVTIGCIPLGDKGIEEIFLIASKTIDNGIKVIISPLDFRTIDRLPKIDKISWEAELYASIQKELQAFHH